VLAVNHPVKNNETKGLSQELALTVRGIYYVKSVAPSHLRLIGLFTGEERTLPREYCVKLSLNTISQLQVQLEALQMQKVSSNLFKANKYLTPNAAKTWNFLLGKNSDPLDHNTSDYIPEDNNFLHQDEESGSQPSVGEGPDPQIRKRKTLRSGNSYSTVQATPPIVPRSILKPARETTSFARDSHPSTSPVILEAFTPIKPAGQDNLSVIPPPPGHSDASITPPHPGHSASPRKKATNRNIHFKDNLSVRFVSGKQNFDYTQMLLVQTEQSCVLPQKESLMLLAFGLDMSRQELCYKSSWSDPNPVNDILDFD
jgi:hypothetical protein